MDSLLGTMAPGVRVCTLDRIRPLDIFNESVCLTLSGYNVHPTCHLNQAMEAPYRILLVFIYFTHDLHLTLHVAVYGTPKLSNMDDRHVMMKLLHYI